MSDSERNDLKFSILIPAYNGGTWVGETLKSILSQSFQNFEIIVQDDASTDNTEEVVRSFHSDKIKFYKNEKNLGCSGNMENLRHKATGDIIYLMGHDDILGEDALLNTYKAFKLSDDIGAVTRPYFWFSQDIATPVRAKKRIDPNNDVVLSMKSEKDKVIKMFSTLDQISGLACKRELMGAFHEDIFPTHVYSFARIFKRHKVVFLKDHTVAVRVFSSQSRAISSLYNKSPIKSWVEMFENVYPEKEFDEFRKYMIENFVAVNYVGLVQIRNFSVYKNLLREIFYLLKYRWKNVFSPGFWFFSLGTMLVPPAALIPLVDWYKERVYAKTLLDVDFKYKL